MMFDLNMDVVPSNNNNNNNNEKERETSIKEDSATNTELSGTSSASSVVNADESPVSGAGAAARAYDFFVPRPSNDSPFVTQQLFPMNVDVDGGVDGGVGGGIGGGGEKELEVLRLGGSSQSSNNNNNNNNQWLNLAVAGSGSGSGPVTGTEVAGKPQVRRSRRGPRSRSSQYRGVTFYRRTGRWESHIWDCGKQVYLGGFDTAHAAARAYDRAAIKFRGVDADINFSIGDYDEDMKQTKSLSKEEFVQILRRQSTGFSRGSSRYRGVTLHKCGRWEARMGQFLGKKYMYLGLYDSEVETAREYDKAAIQCNGSEAVTNFEHGTYEGQMPMNAGDGHNLDLNLGISITIDGPKASNNMGIGEPQTHHQSPIQLANGKRPMNGASTYYPPGPIPLYGQPMASRQPGTMWSGLPQGRPGTYEEKVSDQKLEAMASARLSNWAWYTQSQGQGGGGGGTANQVQLPSNAASSGFPFSTATTSSTTLFTHPQSSHNSSLFRPPSTSTTTSNFFYQYGQGRSS